MLACKALKQVKATLAHSAIDLFPDDVIEADEADLLCLEDISGELDTRFRLRGCKGDRGIEFDLRRALRADALIRSFERSFFRGAGALIASLRALRVALMTSVARIDRSFADKCSPSPCLPSPVNTSFFPLGFGGPDFTPFLEAVVFAVGFAIPGSAVIFGNNRSLSIVAVVGVQVDVELTAARIESAVAFEGAIIIQNTIYCVIEDYTLSRICVQVVCAKKQ